MALPVAYYVIHHGGYWQQRIDAWRDPWVDTNNDNLPDGGIIHNHNYWHDGQIYLFRQ